MRTNGFRDFCAFGETNIGAGCFSSKPVVFSGLFFDKRLLIFISRFDAITSSCPASSDSSGVVETTMVNEGLGAGTDEGVFDFGSSSLTGLIGPI